MRVSVTERQLFKRCRRKWDLASWNRQSLTPIINSPALDLGTLVHAVLAEWTQDPQLDPVAIYNELALKQFQSIIDQYTLKIGCAPSQAEMQSTQDAMILGLSMIENYSLQWHSPLPPGFTLIQNELTLIQPVPDTEHCSWLACPCPTCAYADNDNDSLCNRYECKLELHELECTFDGVMADEHGDLYIIERKTFSRTPSLDELNNNDQFLAYQWALSQQFPNVVGVAYDGLLKKTKPPTSRTKGPGTLNDLFLRRILLRNNHELEEFGLELALELSEMCNPVVPIYKTVPFMGCQRWECSFIDICHATSHGEPTDYLLKMFTRSERKKHLELEN